MADIAECPQCHRQLRLPEELIGREVQCPACATTFTAGAAPEPAPPAGDEPIPFRDEGEAPPVATPPRRRLADDGADYDEDRRPRPTRRDFVPHRGGLVLTLGILSIVCGCAGIIFGPMAWVMGNNDLAEIRAGRMDPEGEGATNAGRVCGIVGTILSAIWVLCCGLRALVGLAVSSSGGFR